MKEYAYNQKINFEYEILEQWEGGLVLRNQEPKILRKKSNCRDLFVIHKEREVFLKGCFERDVKVLLHRKQIIKLITKQKSSPGSCLKVISIKQKKSYLKIDFALVKSKTKHDKRADIKKRDLMRAIKEFCM